MQSWRENTLFGNSSNTRYIILHVFFWKEKKNVICGPFVTFFKYTYCSLTYKFELSKNALKTTEFTIVFCWSLLLSLLDKRKTPSSFPFFTGFDQIGNQNWRHLLNLFKKLTILLWMKLPNSRQIQKRLRF